MAHRDAAVDAYIRRAPSFAKPVLEQVRKTVHAACPDVEEAMKWKMPFFSFEGPLCAVAAFKSHCRVAFWKSALLRKGSNAAALKRLTRISSPSDLPSRAALTALVRAAAKLNEHGVTAKAPKETRETVTKTPDALAAALKKNPRAKKAWDAFAPSHRKEYAAWIAEAKQDATRTRRVEQAMAWMAEGKSRNWKYQR
jgi:uncharacterized protein YdeI (YjbR/CyaY-like superfamily)